MNSDKLKRIIAKASRTHLIIFLLVLHTLIHAKFMNYPPVGYMQWRSTLGLSVARNFHDEGMNILKPRIDSRGNRSGITGMEFPLVNYLTATAYKIFGVKDYVWRSVMLLFSCVAIAFFFLFFELLLCSRALAFAASLLLIFSPLFAYYSSVYLPDIPSLSLLLASFFFLHRWGSERRTQHLVLFSLCFCLSGLVKISALLAIPYILIYSYRNTYSSKRVVIQLSICASIIATWYLFARHLSTSNGSTEFLLAIRPLAGASRLFKIAHRVFLQWLPEMYINYAEFIFMIIGIYALIIERSMFVHFRLFLYWYGGGVLIYMFSMFSMLGEHDYYMIPSLPILVGVATIGIYSLKQRIYESHKKKWWKPVFIVLLVAIPVFGYARGFSRLNKGMKWLSHEQMTLAEHLRNSNLDQEALVIITDDSPSVHLYYARRKGWWITENVSVGEFNRMIDDGAKYLISDSRILETRGEIMRHAVHLMNYGSFNIYELP
jgi:hypothetical protein